MTTLSIAQLLEDASIRLHHPQNNGRMEAQLLLGYCLQKNSSYLLTWPERLIEQETVQIFEAMVSRREQGEPIAYILGEKEFWSLSFKVTPDTLIPRPETELLVELALEKAKERAVIADLGTGSGAIAVAVASEKPDSQVYATDFSQAALDIAKLNANSNNISNIQFFQGDWGKPVAKISFDLILSNPPYIEENDPHLQQGDLRFEPSSALWAQQQGYADIYQIIEFSAGSLNPDGWVLIEHGYQQSQKIREKLESLNYQSITTWKDLAGLDRVTGGRKSMS